MIVSADVSKFQITFKKAWDLPQKKHNKSQSERRALTVTFSNIFGAILKGITPKKKAQWLFAIGSVGQSLQVEVSASSYSKRKNEQTTVNETITLQYRMCAL